VQLLHFFTYLHACIDTQHRVGVVDQGKIGAIEATLAGVHDDAIALQLQVETVYDMMCKVTTPPKKHVQVVAALHPSPPSPSVTLSVLPQPPPPPP